MSDFETFIMCLLIPIVYVLTYIAGKYDVIFVFCKILEENLKEYEKKMKGEEHE